MALYSEGTGQKTTILPPSVRAAQNGTTTRASINSVAEHNKNTLQQSETPISSLEGDPFQFSSISYPRDVTSDMAQGHYMLFYVNVQNKSKYIYDVQDGSQQGVEVKYQENIEGIEGTGDWNTRVQTYADETATYRANIIDRGGTGSVIGSDGVDLRKGRQSSQGLDSVMKTTQRITDSVAIYLPPNVQDSTQAGYTDAATGMAGLAAVGGINFFDAMKRQDFESAASSLVGTAKSFIEEAAKKLGGEILQGLTGAEGVVGLVNKAFGQAENPFMEVLFDQMALRNFSYNFTFAPRNAQETADVQTIIKLFRFHMAPELQGAEARHLTLPSTFDIHYMYQLSKDKAVENSFYSKIATCVLTGCDVNYTPQGVKSFGDGAPTQITMNLSFKETELLTKGLIDKGF
jgi:hypothetical protein